MTDQDVRDMLHRRAADTTPSPDAWDRITERIQGGELAPVVDLDERRRLRRLPPVVLGAIAAAVLVLVGAVVLLQGDEAQQRVEVTGENEDGDRDPVVPTTVVPGPTFESAGEAAARRWVRAAATGDLDGAWDALADGSKEALGSRARLEDMRTGLAEEWGAWDGATGVSLRVVDLTAADAGGEAIPAEIPHLGVAILSGRFAQQGTTTLRTVSLPVRGTGDGAQVDPFVPVNIEIDRESPAGVRAGSDSLLGAYTPAAARVWFVLDDRAPADPELVEGADGDQQHATFTPRPGLTNGQHSFTVVAMTVDGRAASRSTVVTVSAAGPDPAQCGMVGFTPGSEDAASSITALGATCEQARAFLEQHAGPRTSSGGPDQLDVDGYHCVRTASTEDPLPVSSYRCTRGDVTITFDRS